MGRVDIITGTLGKALGAPPAATPPRAKRWLSGCASAPVRICSPTLWRRPSWPPPSKCWRWLKRGHDLRDRCGLTRVCSAKKMTAAGFTLAGADHAIIPVMLGEAVVAQNFARELQKEGIYVTGFFYPVVPKGQARIRTQMSAAHTPEQIERAVEAFTRIGKQLGVIA